MQISCAALSSTTKSADNIDGAASLEGYGTHPQNNSADGKQNCLVSEAAVDVRCVVSLTEHGGHRT